MLQLYDKNKNKIAGLTKCEDLKIESILSSGDKTLSFSTLLQCADGIECEGYIQTKDDEFVIKEIKKSDVCEVTATLNLEELEGKYFSSFESINKTVTEVLATILVGTGWTLFNNYVTKTRNIKNEGCCSVLDIIKQIMTSYGAEIEFDSINKSMTVYESRGTDKGVYFIDSLNLIKLEVEGQTYDYATKLIAEGKDGLTVTVTNNTYSNKVKEFYWKDERYTQIDSLTEDATAKLEEIAKPYVSYAVDIVDLAKISVSYRGLLGYELGDKVTLIDRKKNVNEKHRITKITEYPLEPIRNSCELANKVLSLREFWEDYNNNVTNINDLRNDLDTTNNNLENTNTEVASVNSDLQDTKEQIIILNGDNMVFDGEFQNYSDPAKLPEGATIPYTKTDWDEYPLIYQHDIYYTNGINYNLDNWFTDMFGRKAYTWLQTGGIDGNGCFHANIPVSNYKVGFRLFPRTRYLNIPDDATKLYISLYIKALGKETHTDTDGSVYNRRENFKISFQLWLICCPPGVNYKELSADERVEYDKKYFKVIYTPEIAQMNAWQHSKVAIDLPPLADRAGNKFWFYIEMSDGNGTFEKRCEWDLDKLWMTTNGEIKYKTSPEELNEKIDKKLDGTFATSTDIQALFS